MNLLFSTLIIAVIAIVVVNVILVALLLFVKIKLTPAGKVKININNGTKEIEVTPGSSLLATLAEQKIYEIRQGREVEGLTRLSEVLVGAYDRIQKLSGEDIPDFFLVCSHPFPALSSCQAESGKAVGGCLRGCSSYLFWFLRGSCFRCQYGQQPGSYDGS